ncbi:unnamed protein product [Albugo candida]|uniref:Uncharacterized protein n=1 Tax=Albugo candida TaxID=65357 RepID=A0A024GSF3_9STRA|nr:unnamed protein product [Albugo candida]|eukprot:CCI49292.1 unnamed protein product [Albugo candida]
MSSISFTILPYQDAYHCSLVFRPLHPGTIEIRGIRCEIANHKFQLNTGKILLQVLHPIPLVTMQLKSNQASDVTLPDTSDFNVSKGSGNQQLWLYECEAKRFEILIENIGRHRVMDSQLLVEICESDQRSNHEKLLDAMIVWGDKKGGQAVQSTRSLRMCISVFFDVGFMLSEPDSQWSKSSRPKLSFSGSLCLRQWQNHLALQSQSDITANRTSTRKFAWLSIVSVFAIQLALDSFAELLVEIPLSPSWKDRFCELLQAQIKLDWHTRFQSSGHLEFQSDMLKQSCEQVAIQLLPTHVVMHLSCVPHQIHSSESKSFETSNGTSFSVTFTPHGTLVQNEIELAVFIRQPEGPWLHDQSDGWKHFVLCGKTAVRVDAKNINGTQLLDLKILFLTQGTLKYLVALGISPLPSTTAASTYTVEIR